MLNRQFIFSAIVGLILICLGTIINQQATIGMALMTLGTAIIALALLTRNVASRSDNNDTFLLATTQQAAEK